jgi:hypothetical protein
MVALRPDARNDGFGQKGQDGFGFHVDFAIAAASRHPSWATWRWRSTSCAGHELDAEDDVGP